MNRAQWNLLLASLLALAIFAVLAIAGHADTARMEGHERVQRALAIEIGAELYAAQCRDCHGTRGEGVGQLGPPLSDPVLFESRLDEVGWQGTLESYILNSISMGRVVATRPYYAGDGNVAMVPWAQEYGGPLRPDEIRALGKFVQNWEASATGVFQPMELVIPTPNPGMQATQVEHGRELFVLAGCGSCHTIVGLSTATDGPELTHVASLSETRMAGYTSEEYLRESFLVPGAFIVEGYPARSGCGGILRNDDLSDLISFLLTLQ